MQVFEEQQGYGDAHGKLALGGRLLGGLGHAESMRLTPLDSVVAVLFSALLWAGCLSVAIGV